MREDTYKVQQCLGDMNMANVFGFAMYNLIFIPHLPNHLKK